MEKNPNIMVFSQRLPINKWKEGTISHWLNKNHLLIPLSRIYITRYLAGPNHTPQITSITSQQLNVLLKLWYSADGHLIPSVLHLLKMKLASFFSLWSRELWGISPTFNLESFQNKNIKSILAIPKGKFIVFLWAESGIQPIITLITLRAFKYWIKLKFLPDLRLLRLCLIEKRTSVRAWILTRCSRSREQFDSPPIL